MSETIIQVENIGKKYLIRHQANERYMSLRDVIAGKAASIRRRLLEPESTKRADPTHEEFWALKDVSFKIKHGQAVGIIGRNGAGKSTLLKILSRITEPTTGRIRIKGRVASLLEVGTGFHPELSGRENIYLNGAILGMSKAEIRNKFDEIVAFAEVEKFLDTPVKRYSSGMYVRLAFAVAAHLEPEILLVDEVLAVGDAAFQKKCLGKMGDVAREGRTVLFVSHNMGMIQTLCEYSILLASGVVASEGKPRTVIPAYLSFCEKPAGAHFIADSNLDKSIQILEVSCIAPDESISSSFDIASPIVVCIKYAVKDELIGSVVSLKIARAGTILSTSFDTDQFEHLLEVRNRGCYTVEATIPPMYLKPGYYTVSVGAGILNRERVDFVENAISFEVDSLSIGDSLKSFAPKRDGLIILPVKWKMVYAN